MPNKERWLGFALGTVFGFTPLLCVPKHSLMGDAVTFVVIGALLLLPRWESSRG